MTTRAELRTSLRTRLEDPAVGGIWSDADLDSAIEGAIYNYAIRVPRSRLTTLAIVAGTATYDLPADALYVRSVIDDRGQTLSQVDPTRSELRSVWRTAITWQQTGPQITFTPAPSSNASWQLRYTATRVPINDDVSAQPIEPGDSQIVLALAEAHAWIRRAAADAKRGNRSDADTRAKAATREADTLIRVRTRVATGGVMS